jgi:hypothetical protein
VVFEAVNVSRTFDAGDRPIAGRVIWGDADVDGVVDEDEPTATSGADGSYRLVVPTGAGQTYALRQVVPPGWTQTVPVFSGGYLNVTVLANGNAGPFHFGTVNVPPATVSGRVYDDVNGNGVRDVDDPAAFSGSVYLDIDADGNLGTNEPSRPVVGGSFSIPNVTPGTYTVRQVVPAGRVQTDPGRDERGQPLGIPITVTAGQDVTGLQFGTAATNRVATISGAVFADSIGNGQVDTNEPGVPGCVVYLDADNDAVLDPGERRYVTQNGTFTFAALPPGTHVVRAVTPDGYRPTLPDGGAYVVNVSANQSVTGRNFAFAPPGTAGAITGRLFTDVNVNRARDAGDALRTGTVYIDANNDGQLQSGERTAFAGSAITGFYSFTGLAPGTYVIRPVVPTGEIVTAPADGAYTVTLAAESLAGGYDFGFAQAARFGTVRGTVFNDADGDGVQDTNERLLAGAVAYLDADNDGALDADEKWGMETVDGYTISGVYPGTYALRVVEPPGYTQTRPAGGAAQPITLAVAQSRLASAFGLAPRAGTGTAAGAIYQDNDADGTRDAGEPASGGQFVYADLDGDGMFDPGSEPAARQPVSATGYELRLPPGTYLLRQQLAAGFAQTDPAARDENDLPAGRTVTVAAGQALTGVDFGTVPASALLRVSGVVFDDLNRNGVRDAGEAAPAGRVVYLDADNDGVLDPGERRATQAGGQGYVIADVLRGTRILRVVVPPGYAQTFPVAGAYTIPAGATGTISTCNFGLLPPLSTYTLPAAADTYVRNTSPPAIYGAVPELQVQKSPTPDLQRETYLRFDLAGIGAVASAKLRLFGSVQSADEGPIAVAAYPSNYVAAWDEDSVSWDNKPPFGEPAMSTVTVTGATNWYEWDVSDFLRVWRASGADTVTFALLGVANSSAYVRFNSDETTDPATRPQLVVEQTNVDTRGPGVEAVLFRGSTWAPAFADALAAQGLGSGGYAVPAGPAARITPWSGLDTIVVRFDEPVVVRADDLRVTGAAVPGYSFRDFRYDPATRTATWALDRPLDGDRLVLTLDGQAPGGITDAAGNYLRGGPAGAPGDDVRPATVLAGDVNGDGVVNALDVAFVKLRLNKTPADAGYTVFADVNGDARVNALDVAAVKQRLARRLPAPAAAPAPAPIPAPAALFSPRAIDPEDDLAAVLA